MHYSRFRDLRMMRPPGLMDEMHPNDTPRRQGLVREMLEWRYRPFSPNRKHTPHGRASRDDRPAWPDAPNRYDKPNLAKGRDRKAPGSKGNGQARGPKIGRAAWRGKGRKY